MIMKKAREYARFAILPLMLAALLLAPSCKKDGPKETTTPHTLIFYFTGTELSYYFYRNISAGKDAIRQNIMGRSRVVCFFQHTDKTKADLIELVYVEGSCEEKVLATYDLPKQMDREHLSCFFNEIYVSPELKQFSWQGLYELIQGRRDHPQEGSYTTYLFEKGKEKILKKVGEECTEVIIAGEKEDKAETVYEISDLAYHVLVLMVSAGITVEDVTRELEKRHVIDHKVKQERMQ